jgi:DNA-binding transcriptional ArsR family regulator
MTGKAAEAEQAVLDALVSIGVSARQPERPGSSVDFWVDTPGGTRVPVEVKYTALASVDGLPRQLDRWERALPATVDGQDLLKVLVADRVTAAARDLLRDLGWGWLDLRGHLHLAAPGIFVHADVNLPNGPKQRHSDPFSGKSGLEVAVELLLTSGQRIGIRALAKRINRSPSTVSETLGRLRQAHLVDDDLSPVVPDLFWSLASVWHPPSVDVASLPDSGDHAVGAALKVGLERDAASGWALSDSPAAIVYDAPIALRSHYPPVLYVPDDVTVRRAVQLLGTASDPSNRAGTLRPAPVRAVCSQRVIGYANSNWPLAQPLFVALDLAQDPGRGREILADWTPPKRWSRVW